MLAPALFQQACMHQEPQHKRVQQSSLQSLAGLGAPCQHLRYKCTLSSVLLPLMSQEIRCAAEECSLLDKPHPIAGAGGTLHVLYW